MPGKYSPLEEHLRNLPASQLEVMLTVELHLKARTREGPEG